MADLDLCDVVSECNIVGNQQESLATRHVHANKAMFSEYMPEINEQLYMGNDASSMIEGEGKVVLKLTS